MSVKKEAIKSGLLRATIQTPIFLAIYYILSYYDLYKMRGKYLWVTLLANFFLIFIMNYFRYLGRKSRERE